MRRVPHYDEGDSPAGWRAPEMEPAAPEPDHYAGFHEWREDGVAARCSVEIFRVDAAKGQSTEAGWYWWPCYPGCLPDGDPTGPFPTAEAAYRDATGD